MRDSDAAGFEERWRRRFGEYAAARNDDAGIAGWTSTGLNARLRRFHALWHGCETGPGRLWLDAGCGAGSYTRLLAGHGLQAVGVDYSPASVAKAAARDGAGSWYAAADARRLPFRRGTFQGVICFGVTQALASSDELVRELAAMVAPSGELWIDGLNRHCLPHLAGRVRRYVEGRRMHLRYEASGNIVRLMQSAGLDEVTRYWLPIAPAGMTRLQRCFDHPVVTGILHAIAPLGALASHSFLVRGRRAA